MGPKRNDGQPAETSEKQPREKDEDTAASADRQIEEADEESFPASDPPEWTLGPDLEG